MVMKYQYLNCYSCGAINKGKMMILRNDESPDRNDKFG